VTALLGCVFNTTISFSLDTSPMNYIFLTLCDEKVDMKMREQSRERVRKRDIYIRGEEREEEGKKREKT
jgi:hypothetical protein